LRPLDILDYAFRDYTSNKFKTVMSSLGIIIGVMAIVVMLTLGNGLTSGVTSQFSGLALDTMMVMPGSILAGPQNSNTVALPPAQFTDRDVNLIVNTPGVAAVNPVITLSGAVVTSGGENLTLSVNAIVPQYFTNWYSGYMDKGRFLQSSDTYSVVLGSNVSNGTFDRNVYTGSYINITNPYTGGSQNYQVVGVLKEINASIIGGNPNTAIYMTEQGFAAVSGQTSYTTINVKADSVQNVDTTAQNVQNSLARLHRNEAYSVITQKMFMNLITMVFNMITYVLAGIGGISLVVGGIGIMNVMTLTVRERTKEIGLMKAIGATTLDVRMVFIAESAILGLFSGIAGVVIAGILAAIIGNIAGLSMPMSLTNIALGVGFGLFITTIFGVYPANQAALMDPIEALRAE
jgi:putative ABC transport system permease protein